MASNPMQRQKRISFLLGVVVTLLISAIVIGVLGYFLYDKIKAEQDLKKSMKTVQVLSQDVLSGQVITEDMITSLEVSDRAIPNNACGNKDSVLDLSLQTKEGDQVHTDSDGNLYIEKNNQKKKIGTNDNGEYTIDGDVVELKNVPLIAKVNMKKNTVITRELVAQSDEVNTDDVRTQEFNMVTLPATLETGDFVDIRLRLPNGVDYIVVSKKEVSIPDIAGVPSTDTIDVKMSEDEILTMSNAIVEAYIMNGSELYATKYTDPGNQEKSTPTYPVSNAVLSLINDTSGDGKNIVETAKQALWARYNKTQRDEVIKPQLDYYSVNSEDSVETGIEAQIQKQKELRTNYLEALSGTTTN